MWRSNQLSYRTESSKSRAASTWLPSFPYCRTKTIAQEEKLPDGPCRRRNAPCRKCQPVKVPSRKEVFQPHLPVRLPCYDLAPITGLALGRSSRSRTSGTPSFHGLTGGVYKARERIHRAMADARLLANPASWGRVADPSPNWDRISRLDATCIAPSLCTGHCNTCVAPDVRAVLI